MTATLSASGQLDAAAKQVAAAGASTPLLSLGAEIHPADFLIRPENPVGANARAAYWLAVASRPSTPGARGNTPLYSAAVAALARAKIAAGKWIDSSSIDVFGGSKVPQQVDAILYAAETTAAKNGRKDIAAIFNKMRGMAPTSAATGVSVRSAVAWDTGLVTIGVSAAFLLGASWLLFGSAGKELHGWVKSMKGGE